MLIEFKTVLKTEDIKKIDFNRLVENLNKITNEEGATVESTTFFGVDGNGNYE